jgi:hypothetical protein
MDFGGDRDASILGSSLSRAEIDYIFRGLCGASPSLCWKSVERDDIDRMLLKRKKVRLEHTIEYEAIKEAS